MTEECECCKEEGKEEETCCEDMPVEEVAHSANNKVDALIELLIKKDLIKEEDLEKEFEELFKE